MDKSKHTITIPYDDYITMMETQDKYENISKNISEHLALLAKHSKGGYNMILPIDENRFPTGISSSQYIAEVSIKFYYDN